jgi:hypothetical protein
MKKSDYSKITQIQQGGSLSLDPRRFPGIASKTKFIEKDKTTSISKVVGIKKNRKVEKIDTPIKEILEQRNDTSYVLGEIIVVSERLTIRVKPDCVGKSVSFTRKKAAGRTVRQVLKKDLEKFCIAKDLSNIGYHINLD